MIKIFTTNLVVEVQVRVLQFVASGLQGYFLFHYVFDAFHDDFLFLMNSLIALSMVHQVYYSA